MKNKFSRETLEKLGWDQWDDDELVKMLKDKLQWLVCNNKNYTKEQYWLINDVNEIVSALIE